MTKTPGLCTNTAQCAVARQHRPVLVELSEPFRCPTCGRPLTPPDPSQMKRSLLAPLLAGGAAVLAVLGIVVWLTSGGRPKPPPVAPPPPPPPVAILSSQPAATGIMGSSGPGGPTTAGLITPPPPETLPPATPPQAAATPEAGKPPLRRHRIVAAGGPARLPHKKAGKGEVSVEMLPLDGSRPDYPSDYDEDGREGEVMATCQLQPSGKAAGCRIDNQVGGPVFGESVLAWLARDSTRFPPVLRHGRPVSEKFTWVVDFFP